MNDIMEMEWRLEIFEDQGTLPEAGIEEFKKRLRLRRLKKLLARADSSNSQKGKNSRRNQCPLDPLLPPTPGAIHKKGRIRGEFNVPWTPSCPQPLGHWTHFWNCLCWVCCVWCVWCVWMQCWQYDMLLFVPGAQGAKSTKVICNLS